MILIRLYVYLSLFKYYYFVTLPNNVIFHIGLTRDQKKIIYLSYLLVYRIIIYKKFTVCTNSKIDL